MNCEDINELLAAYAIQALDEVEVRQVRSHLSACRNHDEALAAYEGVVRTLPASVEERDPAPELRSRLLRAFEIESGALREETPGTEASKPSAGPRPARVAPFIRRPALAWLAAAVLLIAVVGLATWNAVLQTNDAANDEDWTVSAQLSGTGVDGHFWYLDERQLAVITMDEMPPLQGGRVYQAWGISDGHAVSLGVLPDQHTVALDADLGDASTFAITIEPAGGSEEPSGEPIATADVS